MKKNLIFIGVIVACFILIMSCSSSQPKRIESPYRITVPSQVYLLPRTFISSDYSYQFQYPGDWHDITNIASRLVSENIGIDVRFDSFFGKYEDDYHVIGVGGFSIPRTDYYTLVDVESSWRDMNYMVGRLRVSGYDGIAAYNDTPTFYLKERYIAVDTGWKIYVFVIAVEGMEYYNEFDDAYNIFIQSLWIQ